MPTAPITNPSDDAKPTASPCVVLQVGEHSAWPTVREAGVVRLTGAPHIWASVDPDDLARAVGNLPKEATICLEVEAMSWAESQAAFERIGGIYKNYSDRAYVAFEIASDETLYGFEAKQNGRAEFLAAAASYFRDCGALVRWFVPLTQEFVHKLEAFYSLAQELEVEAVIARAEAHGLNANDRLFADDFIRHNILEEKSGPLGAEQRQAYGVILAALESDDVDAINGACSSLLCFRQQTPYRRPQSPGASFLLEAAGVLIDGARAHISRTFLSGKQRDAAAISTRFEKVLLIGAYGGEHIGDAAILGGVAFRLNARHGVKKAILMSQRPAHTKHLMPMIETPVTIDVREYRHDEIDACIDEVDAVVFAGGPIIDLPKQLVRHLYAVAKAKARGKPFLMEGVGPGPFQRLPSKLTARQFINLADYISLRTQDNAKEAIIKGIDVEIGRDPAFDYLDTRQGELSRMAPNEVTEIERLLDGAGDRPVIGVNIRPIYHHYTAGVKAEDKASYTEMVEDRFERRLAEALTQFSANSSKKPIIVFFPMNAVQFGLSDLKSAYRISRHLGADIDFRVWEADATLDGVLALIRRLDVAVTMRFHATIFALSQGIEAIGVDYRIGERDKVAAVLSDVGKGDQCARIDEMTAEWMTGQFKRFVGRSTDELKTG